MTAILVTTNRYRVLFDEADVGVVHCASVPVIGPATWAGRLAYPPLQSLSYPFELNEMLAAILSAWLNGKSPLESVTVACQVIKTIYNIPYKVMGTHTLPSPLPEDKGVLSLKVFQLTRRMVVFPAIVSCTRYSSVFDDFMADWRSGEV